MDDFIKLLLPVYFIIYFGLTFVGKSLLVAKRTRKNPLVLPKDDSAYGLIGRYFEFTLIAMFLYVLIFSFVNELHINYLDINILNSYNFKYAGLSLLLFSLGWTILAQYHMRDSWRIGIDNETKTELITSGLFGYSRNPIFFGMVLSLLGLFLLTPNAFTLIFLLSGYMLIQIQIRLEEEFLAKTHGENYLQYKQKVRRLI